MSDNWQLAQGTVDFRNEERRAWNAGPQIPNPSGYIIVSDFEDPEDGVLYWSNQDGWVDRQSATVFPKKVGNLPGDAAGWVRV
jgi:hypothetical protein